MAISYRLALDLGPTSLGWAVFRLNQKKEPTAIIKTGVRIFSDGRNPKDRTSLAATRREARGARRRRDRLLKRKNKLVAALVKYDFFPKTLKERKTLERIDPYFLRAKALDKPLEPHEFGRLMFHLNQRRGFKSNRKADTADNESGLMKSAISSVRENIQAQGCRTVGEWLYRRKLHGGRVRARLHEQRVLTETGRAKLDRTYELYIDRAMVEDEFDAVWAAQQAFNTSLFYEAARKELRDILLFQRKLRAVKAGRCSLLPDEERAPLALPSVQLFRIYQEVNHLRYLDDSLVAHVLSQEQRDVIAEALATHPKRTFKQIRTRLKLSGTFNLEDNKRTELKGNTTFSLLSKPTLFGKLWEGFELQKQDEIVGQLLKEESETKLVAWLVENTGVDKLRALAIANANLPPGYGALSVSAIQKVLPQLQATVCTYDQAVKAAGFEHHSQLDAASTGEIWSELPFYGKALQRHVGFGTGDISDSDEKRYGRIANPTVHIGLNQVRLVVNQLIKRYGHPQQVVVEVARELKQSEQRRRETQAAQAKNQQRNQRYKADIAEVLKIPVERVGRDLLHKYLLWEELSSDPINRCCPYSGKQICLSMLLSPEVEIEHILPFSQTLDDSLNNKTVALRLANRVKGNQTPWQAFGESERAGFVYEEILQRAQNMPLQKRYRFSPNGMEQWLRDDEGFLARALNDTSYLSRITKIYLELICPQATWVIPGQLTGLLRHHFGLTSPDILGWRGQKNRNDHRHHAIDACVIGVTDRSLLQRVAAANAQAKGNTTRLIEETPLPWPTYRDHVKRSVNELWVSHRPDHSYEGAMHDATAYGLVSAEHVRHHTRVEGHRVENIQKLNVIRLSSKKANGRHGYLKNGEPKPYKGYRGNSNYCMEIVINPKNGRWTGEVVSTFQAYQVVRQYGELEGWRKLRDSKKALSGKPLVMRLMRNDCVRLEHEGALRTLRLATIKSSGQMLFTDVHEANADARQRSKEDGFSYISRSPGTLQSSSGRRITISPIGKLREQGFS